MKFPSLFDHRHGKRFLGFMALLQLILIFWVGWRAYQKPKIPFAFDAQLVIQKVNAPPGEPLNFEVGDQIIGINNIPITTPLEFWSILQEIEDSKVTLVFRKFNQTIVKELSPEDFKYGLPMGLQKEDQPIGIACQPESSYIKLRAADIEALRQQVEKRGGQGFFVFNRPVSESTTELKLEKGQWPYTLSSLLVLGFFFIVGMGLGIRKMPQAKQSQAFLTAKYLALLVVSGSWGMAALWGSPWLQANGLLFVISAGALALFKPLNLELHLRRRSEWAPLPIAIRWALWTPALIFWGQLTFFRMRHAQWHRHPDLQAHAAEKISTFWHLILIFSVFLVALDLILSIVRQQIRDREERDAAAIGERLGLGFSTLFSMMAVYFWFQKIQGPWMHLSAMAAIGVQLLGDLLNLFHLPQTHWKVETHEHSVLKSMFKELSTWSKVYLAVKIQAVGAHSKCLLVSAQGEEMTFKICAQTWRDLLDILSVEGGSIPRGGEEDLLDGMASKLDISGIWPVFQATIHDLNMQCFVIAQGEQRLDWEEIEKIEDLMKRESASILREALWGLAHVDFQSIQNSREEKTPEPEKPLTQSTEEPELPQLSDTKLKRDLQSCRESKDELEILVMGLEASLKHIYPHESPELTPAQQRIGEFLNRDLSQWTLLIGEVGVGKTLVSWHAHYNAHRTGPFVRIPAYRMPESVLDLELFGIDDQKGLLESSRGGTLVLDGAHRISSKSTLKLQEAWSAMEDAPRLIFAINLPYDGNRFDEKKQRNLGLKKLNATLRERIDQMAVLPPLRAQERQIEPLADRLLHRAAMRHEKVLTQWNGTALDLIKKHLWPGNIAALRWIIEIAAIVAQDGEEIQPEHLWLQPGMRDLKSQWEGEYQILLQAKAALERDLKALHKTVQALQNAQDLSDPEAGSE